ncbi:hypothetical protein [Bradyrhizobium sp. 23]|uniref:hypothetical protein n=1 Tax=Bradyrhizobium sp. 23 TaxID=2782667 RepID=UPI001FFB61E5|nr:hypothetical protein [Bradyrhizobium sp. 23]MCK1315410.1 hypothetical protein [Bradyrhizobium sp. 23]
MSIGKKPRRYIVFLFAGYYPDGGWDDMRGSFDTIEEAADFARASRDHDDRPWTYKQVVDIETGEVTMIDQPRGLPPL